MAIDISKVGIVILAAGKGKRMQSELPKVMHALHEKPLIHYVVKCAEEIGVKPTVVVADDSNLVKEYLGERASYVIQTERLGTGHAVSMAESELSGKVDHIVILYGDMPFITSKSVLFLLDDHIARSNMVTLMTASVPDFHDWRAQFYDFGRIIRDGKGDIIKIVEKKDASPAELNIMELNSAFFCFNAGWLWKNLKNLRNNNAAGELYLTDLVKIAFDEGVPLSSVSIDPREAVGINTKEHLEKAHAV